MGLLALELALLVFALSCSSNNVQASRPRPSGSQSATAPADPCADSALERARVPGLLAEGKLHRARRVLRRANELCDASKRETWAAEVATLADLAAWDEARTLASIIQGDAFAPTDARAAAADALARATKLDVQFVDSDEAKRPMREKYRAAQEQAEAGNASGARDLYVEAWALWRPNGQALVQAGLEARKGGDVAGAQRLFDRGLEELERAKGAITRVDVPNGLPSTGLSWSSRGRIAVNDGRGVSIVAQHSLAEVLRIDGLLEGVFSPDGATLLGHREGGPLALWDAATGDELGAFPDTQMDLRRARFSADGSRVLVASGKVARVFDTATRALLRTLEHEFGVSNAQMSSDGATLMTAGLDAVYFWSPAEKGEPRRLTGAGHDFKAETAELAADGKSFAVVTKNEVAALLDASTGRPIRTFDSSPRWAVTINVAGFTFSQNGKYALPHVWNRDEIVVWDVATGRVAASAPSDEDYSTACFSPAGDLVAIGGRTLQLRDARTGVLLREASGHARGVNALAFAPDGDLLAVAADAPLRLWDLARGETRAARSIRRLQAVAFSRASDAIFGMSDANALLIGRDLERVRTLFADSNRFAVAPDDRLIALGGWRKAPTLHVSSAGGEAPALEIAASDGGCERPFFASGGRVLGAGCERQLRLWDMATGQLQHDVPAPANIHWIVGAPDDRSIATVHADGIRLWDRGALTDPPRLFSVPSNGPVYSVAAAFSPDSARLATSRDGDVWVWSVADGRPLFQSDVSRLEVRSLAFSTDGRLLAVAGEDGSTRLLRAPTYETISILRGLSDVDAAYVLSSDGHFEVFGGAADAARSLALCRVGAVTFELAVCAERLEVRGLLKSLAAGDTSYLRP